MKSKIFRRIYHFQRREELDSTFIFRNTDRTGSFHPYTGKRRNGKLRFAQCHDRDQFSLATHGRPEVQRYIENHGRGKASDSNQHITPRRLFTKRDLFRNECHLIFGTPESPRGHFPQLADRTKNKERETNRCLPLLHTG